MRFPIDPRPGVNFSEAHYLRLEFGLRLITRGREQPAGRDFHADRFREWLARKNDVAAGRIERRQGRLQCHDQGLAAFVQGVELTAAFTRIWSLPADGFKSPSLALYLFNRQRLHSQSEDASLRDEAQRRVAMPRSVQTFGLLNSNADLPTLPGEAIESEFAAHFRVRVFVEAWRFCPRVADDM